MALQLKAGVLESCCLDSGARPNISSVTSLSLKLLRSKMEITVLPRKVVVRTPVVHICRARPT